MSTKCGTAHKELPPTRPAERQGAPCPARVSHACKGAAAAAPAAADGIGAVDAASVSTATCCDPITLSALSAPYAAEARVSRGVLLQPLCCPPFAGAMEALVRRPDTLARLLAQPWARAVAVSALRALPAGLAAAAQQFAEAYPRLKVKVRCGDRESRAVAAATARRWRRPKPSLEEQATDLQPSRTATAGQRQGGGGAGGQQHPDRVPRSGRLCEPSTQLAAAAAATCFRARIYATAHAAKLRLSSFAVVVPAKLNRLCCCAAGAHAVHPPPPADHAWHLPHLFGGRGWRPAEGVWVGGYVRCGVWCGGLIALGGGLLGLEERAAGLFGGRGWRTAEVRGRRQLSLVGRLKGALWMPLVAALG